MVSPPYYPRPTYYPNDRTTTSAERLVFPLNSTTPFTPPASPTGEAPTPRLSFWRRLGRNLRFTMVMLILIGLSVLFFGFAFNVPWLVKQQRYDDNRGSLVPILHARDEGPDTVPIVKGLVDWVVGVATALTIDLGRLLLGSD